MAKKAKKGVAPSYSKPKDYKYQSGNEGRTHPGMVHPGYTQDWPPGKKPFVQTRDPEEEQEPEEEPKPEE